MACAWFHRLSVCSSRATILRLSFFLVPRDRRTRLSLSLSFLRPSFPTRQLFFSSANVSLVHYVSPYLVNARMRNRLKGMNRRQALALRSRANIFAATCAAPDLSEAAAFR